jgi:hypothetical protein
MINYKTMQKSNIMPTLKHDRQGLNTCVVCPDTGLYINSHVPFLHVCQAHYYGVVSVREALHPFLFMSMS